MNWGWSTNTVRCVIGAVLLGAGVTACSKQPAGNPAALHDAIVLRDVAKARSLIASGVDVNAAAGGGVTPLIAAATSGQLEVIDLLLEAGADINGRGPDGRTALIYAIQAENQQAALHLIAQNGIDSEARMDDGSTALVEAIAFDQMDVATALLDAGADINAPGPVGRTALHVACMSPRMKTINWLLDRGADPDATDDEGSTILHFAAPGVMGRDEADAGARSELDRIIAVLADINAADRNGQTALHTAVTWSHPWVIARLLAAGADPLVQDAGGYSPVRYAMLSGDQGIGRTPKQALAVIAAFRDAGVGDDAIIDAQGVTLRMLEDSIRNQK